MRFLRTSRALQARKVSLCKNPISKVSLSLYHSAEWKMHFQFEVILHEIDNEVYMHIGRKRLDNNYTTVYGRR